MTDVEEAADHQAEQAGDGQCARTRRSSMGLQSTAAATAASRRRASTRPSRPSAYGTPAGSAGTPGRAPAATTPASVAGARPSRGRGLRDPRRQQVDLVERAQLRQPDLGRCARSQSTSAVVVQFAPQRAGGVAIAAGEQRRAGQGLEPVGGAGHRAGAFEVAGRGRVVLEPPVVDEADVVRRTASASESWRRPFSSRASAWSGRPGPPG